MVKMEEQVTGRRHGVDNKTYRKKGIKNYNHRSDGTIMWLIKNMEGDTINGTTKRLLRMTAIIHFAIACSQSKHNKNTL